MVYQWNKSQILAVSRGFCPVATSRVHKTPVRRGNFGPMKNESRHTSPAGRGRCVIRQNLNAARTLDARAAEIAQSDLDGRA